jgi:hypothetical protein
VTDGVTTCDQLRDFIPLHCDVFGLLDALHDVALEAFQVIVVDPHKTIERLVPESAVMDGDKESSERLAHTGVPSTLNQRITPLLVHIF